MRFSASERDKNQVKSRELDTWYDIDIHREFNTLKQIRCYPVLQIRLYTIYLGPVLYSEMSPISKVSQND